MAHLFRESYYCADLLIGFGGTIVLAVLYRIQRLRPWLWKSFWIGVSIGLLWEIPIFVLSAHSGSTPIIFWIRPLIAPYPVFLVCHALWDGLIFIAGIKLVEWVCPLPACSRFRWQELAVLLAWGQISELLVEISSVYNEGWAYIAYPWNPALLMLRGYPITLLLQVTWAVATLLFYRIIVRLPKVPSMDRSVAVNSPA